MRSKGWSLRTAAPLLHGRGGMRGKAEGGGEAGNECVDFHLMLVVRPARQIQDILMDLPGESRRQRAVL